ncbi:toxin [Streptomyces sp. NRRL B-1140]|nr:toxin [Streptomyces sp. NRRL B-1140]
MEMQWRKSTYSGDQGGQCLEVAETPEVTVAIRDSKTPAGPILTLDPAAFTTFVKWTTTTTAE